MPAAEKDTGSSKTTEPSAALVAVATTLPSGPSSSKLNIMLTEIAKNTSTAAVTITTTPTTFSADGGTQDIAFTVANAGSNKTYAKIEGTGFSVPTGEVTSSVKVTAEANDGAAREAKLTIYVAASENGAAVAEASVTLNQSAKPAAGSETITLDFVTSSFNISTSSSNSTEATFATDGYTFKYCYLKYYDNTFGTYVMFDSKSNEGSYLTLPAISGKKLVKVSITNRKGASAKAKVAIYPENSTDAVAGGEASTWPEDAQTAASELTFNLTGTETGVAYRIYAIKGANAQATKIVLEYE